MMYSAPLLRSRGQLLSSPRTPDPHLHQCIQSTDMVRTCKLHTHSHPPHPGSEPRMFLLRGDSANHYATIVVRWKIYHIHIGFDWHQLVKYWMGAHDARQTSDNLFKSLTCTILFLAYLLPHKGFSVCSDFARFPRFRTDQPELIRTIFCVIFSSLTPSDIWYIQLWGNMAEQTKQK